MTDADGVLEIGEFFVLDGHQDAFLDAFRGVRDVLASTPGCRAVRMTHGIDTPTRFTVLVQWDDVAAHLENFRATDRFTSWRAALGPHFAEQPHVEHYEDVS